MPLIMGGMLFLCETLETGIFHRPGCREKDSLPLFRQEGILILNY